MEGDAGAESEGFFLQCTVNCGQVLGATAGEIIKIFFIGGGEEGFAPGKEGLGVEADGAFVKFCLVVKIAPSAFGRGAGDCGQDGRMSCHVC